MQLDQSTVLVTGGCGGIGSLLVERLRSAGARVTVADRAKSGEAEDFIATDLADPQALDELCRRIAADTPDILVNLAGINAFCPFESHTAGQLTAMMQVNLLTPMRLVHAALPAMLARRRGQVVNIGSVLGDIGSPYFTAYSSSKAGLDNFSESLRREVAGRGVTVTYVAPRAVKTAMNDGPIETFIRLTKATEDDPGKVAERILGAIRDDRANLTIGFPENFFVKVNALWPSVVDRELLRRRRIAEDLFQSRTH